MPRSSHLSKAICATLGLALSALAAPTRSQAILVTTRYFTIEFPSNWKTTPQTNPPDSTYATVLYSNGNEEYGAQVFSKLHNKDVSISDLVDSVEAKAIKNGFNVDEMKECTIGSYQGACGRLRHTVDAIELSIACLMVGKLEFQAELLIFPNMSLTPQTDFKNALSSFKLIGTTGLLTRTGKSNPAVLRVNHDALGRIQPSPAINRIGLRGRFVRLAQRPLFPAAVSHTENQGGLKA